MRCIKKAGFIPPPIEVGEFSGEKVKYVDLYGIERDAVIDLPYSEVPVGGQLKIAYNSENYKEVHLVEAVFMDTPEYIEKMRKRGYIKTQDGFVKKNMKKGN